VMGWGENERAGMNGRANRDAPTLGSVFDADVKCTTYCRV